MAEYTVNMFEFSENENFDMFNDLTLNPNDDILPNLTYSYMGPSNDTSVRTTVYRYRDVEFGMTNVSDTMPIPLIWLTVSELGNMKHCAFLDANVGNIMVGKNYYESSYQYYNGYEQVEFYRSNANTGVSSLISLNIPVWRPDSYADDCSYLTDGNLNYSYFVPPFYINTNIPIILCDADFDSGSNNAKAYARHQMTLDDYVASDEHILPTRPPSARQPTRSRCWRDW